MSVNILLNKNISAQNILKNHLQSRNKFSINENIFNSINIDKTRPNIGSIEYYSKYNDLETKINYKISSIKENKQQNHSNNTQSNHKPNNNNPTSISSFLQSRFKNFSMDKKILNQTLKENLRSINDLSDNFKKEFIQKNDFTYNKSFLKELSKSQYRKKNQQRNDSESKLQLFYEKLNINDKFKFPVENQVSNVSRFKVLSSKAHDTLKLKNSDITPPLSPVKNMNNGLKTKLDESSKGILNLQSLQKENKEITMISSNPLDKNIKNGNKFLEKMARVVNNDYSPRKVDFKKICFLDIQKIKNPLAVFKSQEKPLYKNIENNSLSKGFANTGNPYLSKENNISIIKKFLHKGENPENINDVKVKKEKIELQKKIINQSLNDNDNLITSTNMVSPQKKNSMKMMKILTSEIDQLNVVNPSNPSGTLITGAKSNFPLFTNNLCKETSKNNYKQGFKKPPLPKNLLNNNLDSNKNNNKKAFSINFNILDSTKTNSMNLRETIDSAKKSTNNALFTKNEINFLENNNANTKNYLLVSSERKPYIASSEVYNNSNSLGKENKFVLSKNNNNNNLNISSINTAKTIFSKNSSHSYFPGLTFQYNQNKTNYNNNESLNSFIETKRLNECNNKNYENSKVTLDQTKNLVYKENYFLKSNPTGKNQSIIISNNNSNNVFKSFGNTPKGGSNPNQIR